MSFVEDLFKIQPFSLNREEKAALLIDILNQLHGHHLQNCEAYSKIHAALGSDGTRFAKLSDFPFIPVSLFKTHDLRSIPEKETIKTLTSSGTTSQRVSNIFLDKRTALYQTKALVSILQNFIGKIRLPMIIVDSENVIKNRRIHTARGAGILGMMNFGRDHFYLLDENENVRKDDLLVFLAKHADDEILIFGFTFMVWLYLYKEIGCRNLDVTLQKGILVHSGGWKKMQDMAIDNVTFKKELQNTLGISRICNFYGMVEQVGSIFMECEYGNLHVPIFSDIIIRDPFSWLPLDIGAEGLIEVISVLPYSYPGNVLLTEDIGTIKGEDDCECGRLGKYVAIKGRMARSEARGCSDTYQSK